MNNVKPGWTTTEFWMALGTNIIAILTLFHIAVPANTSSIVGAAAFLLATVADGLYIHSRGVVKSAAAMYPVYPSDAGNPPADAAPPAQPVFPVAPTGAGAGVTLPLATPPTVNMASVTSATS